MCRSGQVADWTISELAVILEITQAYLFADKPHTQSSLIKALGLSKQTVSRQVIKFEKRGIVRQKTSKDDARNNYLYPTDHFFTRDALLQTAEQFAGDWLHGFENIDKANQASWFPDMESCTSQSAKRGVEKFASIAQASDVESTLSGY